jgi:hypothetical protein
MRNKIAWAALVLTILGGLTGGAQASIFVFKIGLLSFAEGHKLKPIKIIGCDPVKGRAPDDAITVHISDHSDNAEAFFPPSPSRVETPIWVNREEFRLRLSKPLPDEGHQQNGIGALRSLLQHRHGT